MSIRISIAGALVVVFCTVLGCQTGNKSFVACDSEVEGHFDAISADIQYPATNTCTDEGCDLAMSCVAPRTLSSGEPAEYRELSLSDAVQMALSNTTVLSDLGGAIVRSPATTRTVHDPSIAETDPTLGIESALSAFDAQWTTSLFSENNDRALNNQFFGGGTRILQQNASVFQSQLSKRGVAGTEMSARKIVEFDGNNAPGNRFPGAWTVKMEGEVRQPLLQGAGMMFNRIAGPNRTPGVYNGVLLARLNTDVQLSDFEIAVRNYVSNVENAYWDLYFAYRDLDAQKFARDAALDTWQRIEAKTQAGVRDAEGAKEAQAREQYFRFKEEVENSLSGRLFDGTRTGNGSLAGTFRGTGGLLVAERRLRRLLNLPASDGKLLRPMDEPKLVPVYFDWCDITNESLARRAELRRQKFRIRGRELELIASKNHLLPRLDAVGLYRFRGFGQDLIDSDGNGVAQFDNAVDDLVSGDFQEWQVGFELDVPIGFRRAHTAVRNAELQLARERAIFCEQQEEVIHEVASAVAEVDRAYTVSQTTLNRLIASRDQLELVEVNFRDGNAPLDLLLDAQRRVAESQSRYYRSLAEYAVAIKNVHFVKGSLLEYDGVYLAEGQWPCKAYEDAQALESRRGQPIELDYLMSHAPVVAKGPYSQKQNSGATQVAVEQPGSIQTTPRPAEKPEQLPEVPATEMPASEATIGRPNPFATPDTDWGDISAIVSDKPEEDLKLHPAAPIPNPVEPSPRMANEESGKLNPFR